MIKIFDYTILCALFMFAILFPVSITGRYIGIGLATLAWIWRIFWTHKNELKGVYFTRILLIFIFVSVISFLLSPYKLDYRTIIPIEIFLYFLVVCGLNNFARAKLVLLCLAISIFISNIIVAVKYILIGAYSSRLEGFLDTNSVGGLLGMFLPLPLSFVVSPSKIRLVYLFFSIPMLFVLIFTFTRGAWLGLFCAIVIISLLSKKYKMLIITVGIVLLLGIIPSPVSERIKSIVSIKQNQERIEILRNALQRVRLSPIIGIGPGCYYYLGHKHCHNNFLQIFIERGLIGLILYIWLLVAAFYRIATIYSVAEGGRKILLSGILGSITGFVVHSMVDYTFSEETLYLFFFFLGIAILIKKSYEQENTYPTVS